jgi:hypothetical protein
MTTDQAETLIFTLLERYPEIVDRATVEGDRQSAGQLAADIVAWFNRSAPSRDDVRRLAALLRAGRFQSWACPTCGDRVHLGDPEDWDHFQGAHQADYASYPGYDVGPKDRRCDSCRFRMVGAADYLPEGARIVVDD